MEHTDPVINPLTEQPYANIAEFDGLAAKLADMYVEDPEFKLSDNPDVRELQLRAFRNGLGATVTEASGVEIDGFVPEGGPHILDVSDEPFGALSDEHLRLIEQGQASAFEHLHTPQDTFAYRHPDWRPYSIREMTVANEGLAGSFKDSVPLAGIETQYSLAEQWHSRAQDTAQTLSDVTQKPFSSATELGKVIYEDDAAMQELIDIRLQAKIFETGKKVLEGKSTYNKLRREVTSEVTAMSSDDILSLWRSGLRSAEKRRDFWAAEIDAAQQHPRLQMARRERAVTSASSGSH